MHSSPLIISLAFAAFTAASAVPAGNQDCVTVESIQVIHAGVEAVCAKFDVPFPADFPDISSISNKDAKSCVDKSLSNATTDIMVQLGLEIDVDQKLADMQALQARGTSDVQLFKRARSCREIQSSTRSNVRSRYSCESAPNEAGCETCASLSGATFGVAVANCGFKETAAEALSCCALAALAFVTYYSQYCLEKS